MDGVGGGGGDDGGGIELVMVLMVVVDVEAMVRIDLMVFFIRHGLVGVFGVLCLCSVHSAT